MLLPLNILILEDNPADAEIVQRVLKKGNLAFNSRVSMTKEEFLRDLDEFQPDLVLADYSLPQFNATEALEVVNQQWMHIPFILVTGSMSEEFAVDIIKKGADDYILKDRLGRLPAAIEAALSKKRFEYEKNIATRRLVESEQKYRTLVEQAFDGSIIYSPRGIILDCNQSACTYLGYLQEELKGMAITELFYKEDLEARPLRFEALKAGKPTLDYRQVKTKTGKVLEMEIATKMMPDGNLMAVGRDITERKEAERKIIQSEENLKTIFDNTTEGFILLDTKGVIKAFNNRAKTSIVFNAASELKTGFPLIDFMEPARQIVLKAVFARVLDGETIEYDRSYTSDKDTTTWLNFTFTPVKKGELITGICITGRDITALKIAEQQKEFDRSNLSALINNTNDLIWSVDREMRLITANQAFINIIKEMTGHVIINGNSILDEGFSKAQLNRYQSFYERAFRGEAFTELEHIEHPVELWAEVSFFPIYENKKVVGTACFARNITERKKSEDRIRTSNERYTTVAKATSDAIWDHDFITGKTYIAGTGYKHLFGYKIVNDYSEDGFWESRLHPDDKDRVLRELEQTLATPKLTQGEAEYRFRKADGTYAYVNDRYFIIRRDGKPVKMLGAKQDITIRKKAEEELQRNFQEKQALAERMTTILNTLPATIALLDNKGIIADINDAWRNCAVDNGFIGSNHGIGGNYIAIARNAENENIDGKLVADGIEAVLAQSINQFEYEYASYANGEQRWFRMIATPFQDKEYAGAVVMHTDISQLRRLEQERLEGRVKEQKRITRAMVYAQEKERNQLGRELHDNVSQLLAAIKMKLAFAAKRPDRSIPIIQECIEHVQEAVDETRNLSHRMVMPRFAESSFKDAMEMLIANYENGKRAIRFSTDKLDEARIPAVVKETLYRIAQEQLHNIEKYANASVVTVQVSANTEQACMQIEDNGLGFDMSKKRNGIGLTNIHNRAESYNGSAKIISSPGQGCKLMVKIPLVEESSY